MTVIVVTQSFSYKSTYHTELKRALLPNFPETIEDTVNMALFISCPCTCIIQINILPFWSIYPQKKPFQLLDRNNTEAWKKINLIL